MKLYAIEKKMSFCAAHILDLEEDHPCSTIHGHQYHVNLRIESNKLSKNGFVIDFNDLKGFKEDFIDGELDHSTLFTKKMYNKYEDEDEDKQFFKKVYILPKSDKNTTVEILARHIHLKLIDYLAEIGYDKFSKVVVRVSETDNNVGEYTEIDDEEKDIDDTDEVTNSILEDRIDNLYEKIEELDERLESLDGELEEKFDEIDEKLDHLKNVYDELEEETDNNNSDLNQLKEDVLNIDNAFNDLEGRVEDIENLLEME